MSSEGWKLHNRFRRPDDLGDEEAAEDAVRQVYSTAGQKECMSLYQPPKDVAELDRRMAAQLSAVEGIIRGKLNEDSDKLWGIVARLLEREPWGAIKLTSEEVRVLNLGRNRALLTYVGARIKHVPGRSDYGGGYDSAEDWLEFLYKPEEPEVPGDLPEIAKQMRLRVLDHITMRNMSVIMRICERLKMSPVHHKLMTNIMPGESAMLEGPGMRLFMQRAGLSVENFGAGTDIDGYRDPGTNYIVCNKRA